MRQDDRSADGRDRRRSRGRRLTDRQAAILELVSDGLANKEIARQLGISEQAVKEHVSALLRILAAPNRAALGDAAATRRFTGTTDLEPDWLRFLFQQAPIHVAVLAGPDHVFVAVNEAYQAASGGRPLIGRRYVDAFPERTVSAGLIHRAFVTEERQIRADMPRRFTRAGSTIEEDGYVTAVIEPLPATDDSVAGVVIFSIDVTEAVRARMQLREIEAEELAILDHLPIGVIVADRTGRVFKMNQEGRQILPEADPGGMIWDLMLLRDPVTGRELPREEQPVMRALRGEGVPDTELVAVIRTSGQQVFIRVSAAPLAGADGSVRAALVMFGLSTRQPS